MTRIEELKTELAEAQLAEAKAYENFKSVATEVNKAIQEFLSERCNPMGLEVLASYFEIESSSSRETGSEYKVSGEVQFKTDDPNRIARGFEDDFGSSFQMYIYENDIKINKGTIGTYGSQDKFQVGRDMMLGKIWENKDALIECVNSLIDIVAFRLMKETESTTRQILNKLTFEEYTEKRNNEIRSTYMRIELAKNELDLVNALIGQMSDGYWENNPDYEKYWRNMELLEDGLYINVDKLKYRVPNSECENVWSAGVRGIRKWLARKAQIIQNADLRDNQSMKTGADVNKYIAKICGDKQAHYMDRGVNQTYEQVQDAINSLRDC